MASTRSQYHGRMRRNRSAWVVLGAPVVTLALGFGWTWDSQNTIKFFVLGLMASFALAQLISAIQNSRRILLNPGLIVSICFLAALLIPLVFSNSPFSQQIYGTTGRNIGFSHYFFLILIFATVSISKVEKVMPSLFKSLVFTGVVEAIYGVMQFLDLDPAPWKNSHNWIFGTLGNPNFLSSFLALSAIATFYIVMTERNWVLRFAYIVCVILQASVMLLSSSIQGPILLFFGILALILVFLLKRSKMLGWSFAVFSSIFAIIAIFGAFQSGPLSRYIYQDSVSFRGDYWRAGIRMFQSNWTHGVGLDSFGDFYRIYRDPTAANRRGLDVVSNSAHNLFIDLAATGGILLLFTYLSLIGIVLHSIVKKLRSGRKVSLDYKILIILWVAFNLQTLISINVPGLAVWGWIFSGLLVSYGVEDINLTSQINSASTRKALSLKFVAAACIVLCGLFTLPLINREVQLSKAMAANDIPRISTIVSTFPRDSELIASVAVAYEKLGSYDDALKLARIGVSENPNSIRCWQIIFRNPIETKLKKAAAAQAIRRLEPNNPSGNA